MKMQIPWRHAFLILFVVYPCFCEQTSSVTKMNLLGVNEQGSIQITTQADGSSTSTWVEHVQFTSIFLQIPNVLLTMTSVRITSGTSNSYGTQVGKVTQQGFTILIHHFEENSAFEMAFRYLVFESNKYLQVYSFNNFQTQLLQNYTDSSIVSQVQSEKLMRIQLLPQQGKSLAATVFLNGVKVKDSESKNVAVSVNTQVNYVDRFVEVLGTTWNNVKIESLWFTVITYESTKSFQGEWKNYLFDSDKQIYKVHPWTTPTANNRFAQLTLPIKISSDVSVYSASYGIRGFDIRNGQISVLVGAVNYNLQTLVATADVGTSGEGLLVGAQINTVILGEIHEIISSKSAKDDDDLSPIIISAIVALCLVVAFIAFSVIYLKYFSSPDVFKHQQLEDSPRKQSYLNDNDNNKNNTTSTDIGASEQHSPGIRMSQVPPMTLPSSNIPSGPTSNQQSSERLNLKTLIRRVPSIDAATGDAILAKVEFPERLDLKEQVGRATLLSKDLLTGIKVTNKQRTLEVKDSVIVEQTNEASTKSQSNAFSFDGGKSKYKFNDIDNHNIYEESEGEENDQSYHQKQDCQDNHKDSCSQKYNCFQTSDNLQNNLTCESAQQPQLLKKESGISLPELTSTNELDEITGIRQFIDRKQQEYEQSIERQLNEQQNKRQKDVAQNGAQKGQQQQQNIEINDYEKDYDLEKQPK